MARSVAINFPLILKNNVKVRSIEELRENFDIEKIMEYYCNGKLLQWLERRYYDEIAEKIKALSQNNEKLVEKIAEILGAKIEKEKENTINIVEIQEKVNLKEKVKDWVAEEYLEKIDFIADSQERFETLIERGYRKIYLYEGEFVIRRSFTDLEIIGIKEPVKIKIEAKDERDFAKQNIVLKYIDYATKEDEEKVRNTVQSIFIRNLEQMSDVMEQINQWFGK